MCPTTQEPRQSTRAAVVSTTFGTSALSHAINRISVCSLEPTYSHKDHKPRDSRLGSSTERFLCTVPPSEFDCSLLVWRRRELSGRNGSRNHYCAFDLYAESYLRIHTWIGYPSVGRELAENLVATLHRRCLLRSHVAQHLTFADQARHHD
jgi:hypothetical protein